jgi:hypothetical protein
MGLLTNKLILAGIAMGRSPVKTFVSPGAKWY